MNSKLINFIRLIGVIFLILSIYLEIYFFLQLFKTTNFPFFDKILYPKDTTIFFCLYFLAFIIGSIGLILLKKWGRITLIIASIFGFIVVSFMGIDNILYFGLDIKVIIYLLIFLFLIIFLFNKKVATIIKKSK